MLLAYALEWLQILIRCIHIVTGIAWIGASFYFVWLDNHLLKPVTKDLLDKGVDGELWAVHGGGFYNPQKYLVAPKTLPEHLHWFYWESYSTWLSGFALFVVMYLVSPRALLIDPKVADLGAWQAVALALGFLVAGWVIYDTLCRLLQGRDRLLGLLVAIMVTAVSYLTMQLFAARAAILLTGAMMATSMTANVFFWIIPGQRRVIAAMRAGKTADPMDGKRGKQRSVHNTYFTLPVVFAMLANHFHLIYSHRYAWVLVVLMMLAMALIRHFFVLRHKDKQVWSLPAFAAALISVVIVWCVPEAQKSVARAVTDHEAQAILTARCQPCHSGAPTLLPVAPKGLLMDNPEVVATNRQTLHQQACQQPIMPPGNITEMTDDERALLCAWLSQPH
jgi:uncharacterized membrane protein